MTDLIYSIPTNEDYYTSNEDDYELLPALLERIADNVSHYLKENFPTVSFEVQEVSETMSYNNKSRAYTKEAQEALESVSAYVENNWFEWWV